MKKFLSIIILIFFCVNLNSQNFKIKGTIIDKQTNKPLAFANIYSLKLNFSVISNSKGEFIISLKNNSDTLIITYLGYKNLYVFVDSLKSFNQNIFKLETQNIQLSDINVKPTYTSDLILKALEKITENYSNTSMYFTSYFSETITENDSTIQQIEAILEIQKSCYSDKNIKDKIKFTHGQILKNEKDNNLWNYIYFVNAPYELLYSDIAKNPYDFLQIPDNKVNFLNKNDFKYFNYKLDSSSNSNQIIIKFEPNPKYQKGVYEGKIILDKENYAIVCLDFKYSESRLEKVYYTESLMEIEFRNAGINNPDNYYHSKIDYIKKDNIWILNEVTNQYGFIFQIGNGEKDQIMVKDKLLITNINNENIKIGFFQQLIKDVKLIDQIPKTDSIFWKNYKY